MNAKAARQQRLVTLLVALMLVAAGAWIWFRSHERQPPPPASDPLPANSAATSGGGLAHPQKLPEFDEVEALLYLSLKEKRLPSEKVPRAIELSTHRISYIRSWSTDALGSAEDATRPEAIAAVLDRLRDSDMVVRLSAIAALARLDAKDHIPDLLPFLNSTENSERHNARIALQKLGHPID